MQSQRAPSTRCCARLRGAHPNAAGLAPCICPRHAVAVQRARDETMSFAAPCRARGTGAATAPPSKTGLEGASRDETSISAPRLGTAIAPSKRRRPRSSTRSFGASSATWPLFLGGLRTGVRLGREVGGAHPLGQGRRYPPSVTATHHARRRPRWSRRASSSRPRGRGARPSRPWDVGGRPSSRALRECATRPATSSE